VDDDDEAVITQLGLLLTQVRYARMALDGIEHATSRYAGLSLTVAGAGATPWGAPPMIDGALKVYVVNISDLTAGASIGDVVAGAIGGVGRFLGGFAGGLVGGTVSGVLWPWVIYNVSKILDRVESILAKWGKAAPPTTPAGAVEQAAATPPPAQATISEQLQSITALVKELGALFTAAGSGDTTKTTGPGGAGTAPGGITAALQPALALAIAATHLVDGLILLVPLLMGALAALLARIDLIQLKVLDLMEFALRAALLLRAAILGTVLDTIALVGRLAATTLGLIITALEAIIPSIFRLVLAALDTALTALQIASTGLKNVIDGLMTWLRDGLGAILIFIGNLRVFRLIEHLVQVAPALLAALARLMGTPLSRVELRALNRASRITLPGGSGAPSALVPVPGAPDLAALALPASARADLRASIDKLGTSLATETKTSLTALQGALGGIGTTFRGAVDRLDTNLSEEVGLRSKIAAADVAGLTTAIGAAREATRVRPDTGLEQIARAYETWLKEGGMTTLLKQISTHFKTEPTEGAAGETSLPGRTLRAAESAARDRAVIVEIGEVVIDLGPAPTPPLTPQPTAWTDYDPDAPLDREREIDDRGGLLPA
jgi:hypothetical protein